MQFVFVKKLGTCKILKGDLEQLPLALCSKPEKKLLVTLSEKAIAGEDINDKLNETVFEMFRLSNKDREFIRQWNG